MKEELRHSDISLLDCTYAIEKNETTLYCAKIEFVDHNGKPLDISKAKHDTIITNSYNDKWILTNNSPVNNPLVALSRREFVRNSFLLLCGSLVPLRSVYALGKPETHSLISSILQTNPLGFQGERLDLFTGLYPLGQGYRWYSPVLRRFCQYDRIASPFGIGGANGYAFAMNNPVGMGDPSGQGVIASIIAFISSLVSMVSACVSAVTSAVSSVSAAVGTATTVTSLIGGASGSTAATLGSWAAVGTKAAIYTSLASGTAEAVRSSVGAIALAAGADQETAMFAENIAYNVFAAAFFLTAAFIPISTSSVAARVAGSIGRSAASLGVISQITSATGSGIASSNPIKATKFVQATLWFGVVADALSLMSAGLTSLKISRVSSSYNLNSMKSKHSYRLTLRSNNLGINDLNNKIERFTNIGVNALESTATNLAVVGYYGQSDSANRMSNTITVFNHGVMAGLNRRQLAHKEGHLNFLKEGFRTVRIGYKGSWALNSHLPLHEEAFYARDE